MLVMTMSSLCTVYSGGMIVVDNTLWNGRVCDDTSLHRGQTKTIHEFNTHVLNDQRTCKTLVPLRDGMTVIRLR
jgi:caffeoyl-CoA O-methyltransferase